MRIMKSQLVEKPENWGRHVVILGAGAIVAAWVEENPLLAKVGFEELLSWVKPLVEAEINMGKSKDQGGEGGGDIDT
jgi:hypothetical protein